MDSKNLEGRKSAGLALILAGFSRFVKKLLTNLGNPAIDSNVHLYLNIPLVLLYTLPASVQIHPIQAHQESTPVSNQAQPLYSPS